jgi:excisionase family DNA binding protein
MASRVDASVSLRKSERDLIKLFLSLPKPERLLQFADTARTADMVGTSRRTIQFWIEVGQIQAVRVGNKYYVLVDSVHQYLGGCNGGNC